MQTGLKYARDGGRRRRTDEEQLGEDLFLDRLLVGDVWQRLELERRRWKLHLSGEGSQS
jgi:hypothetical protein